MTWLWSKVSGEMWDAEWANWSSNNKSPLYSQSFPLGLPWNLKSTVYIRKASYKGSPGWVMTTGLPLGGDFFLFWQLWWHLSALALLWILDWPLDASSCPWCPPIPVYRKIYDCDRATDGGFPIKYTLGPRYFELKFTMLLLRRSGMVLLWETGS